MLPWPQRQAHNCPAPPKGLDERKCELEVGTRDAGPFSTAGRLARVESADKIPASDPWCTGAGGR
jgi:hypothetical protein